MPPKESIFPAGSGNLFRSEQTKVSVGDVYTVPGMRVTVREMGPEGPRSVRIELDRPLDDPRFLWLSERQFGFYEALPPAEGFGKPFDP